MIQDVLNYKKVLSSLGDLINNAPYKKNYIIEKVGITAPTFYRKLKNHSFTPDEVEKIIRLLEPKQAYAYELEQSLKRGKNDYEKGNYRSRVEVFEEIKASLK